MFGCPKFKDFYGSLVALQTEGHRFDPASFQFINSGPVSMT